MVLDDRPQMVQTEAVMDWRTKRIWKGCMAGPWGPGCSRMRVEMFIREPKNWEKRTRRAP